MNITGVILAAGEGTRMGGAVKQMLPFNGATVLEQVVDNATASILHQVFVVVGHRADLIAPLLDGRDVTVVNNRDYRKGQSSSVKRALLALPEDTDAVLFLLGDQPLVLPQTINLIINRFKASQHPIVIPVYNGHRGNPALFSREMFSRLLMLDADNGGRALFQEYAGKILELPVEDPHILFDIDTLEDYATLLTVAGKPRVFPLTDKLVL